MAPRNSTKINNNDMSYNKRRRYAITELLWMRETLPYVCCPVRSFKPEAWTEKILIRAAPATNLTDPNERLRAKILTARLELYCPHELISRQQKQEALDRLITKRKPLVRGAPPKPRVMPTIPEVPVHPNIPMPAPAVIGGLIRPASLGTGLSGGYGKRIEATPTNHGLTASMHAFVPRGTLKTAPVIAIDAGDGSNWDMKENLVAHKTNTLSLADGLGFNRMSAAAASTIVVASAGPVVTLTAAKEKLLVDASAKHATAGNTGKTNIGSLKTLAERPKALMAERSTNNDQMAWIQFMKKKQIISISRKTPQTKEALGASIDDADDRKRFKALDDIHEGKLTIGPPW